MKPMVKEFMSGLAGARHILNSVMQSAGVRVILETPATHPRKLVRTRVGAGVVAGAELVDERAANQDQESRARVVA